MGTDQNPRIARRSLPRLSRSRTLGEQRSKSWVLLPASFESGEARAVRTADLHIDRERLAELCRRFGVSKLEVFGSFATGDADASSDIDVLVTFAPGEAAGLGVVEFQQALEELLGRSVDLLTRESVERSANKYFRRFALRSTEPLYEAA